ncbi:hypothetical protein [Clostridium sp. DJ247]|nr:hypothetical protein [Clostridium sp. DJ247]MBC2579154.1 hypothetical protein [Clostridium sp. DJ247]
MILVIFIDVAIEHIILRAVEFGLDKPWVKIGYLYRKHWKIENAFICWYD